MFDGGWHEIAHRKLEFGMRTDFIIEFPEIHGDAKKVKFNFHNEHGTEGLQLGEIIFFHLGEALVQPMMHPTVVVEERPQQQYQQPIIQAAAMAMGLQRIHLHERGRVTAEHHAIGNNPQNLLSPGIEDWNKWHADNHQRSWVEIEFAAKIEFKGIGFKSAGDHPRRSPSEVRIHVFHALEGGWHEIAHRQLEFGMRTLHTIDFPEIHGDTKRVKFDFHN